MTQYECNLEKKGTKYEWNVHPESDHVWLQSLSEGTKYDCNVENHHRIT